MKKIVIVLAALSIMFVAEASKPKVKRTVLYRASIECKSCKTKILDNIAFEKGVKDVVVNLPEKTVKIVFDEAKTDTLTLAKAIRKLGYKAKVIKFE
ncbi:MAG: heavy-metal-associated domain-containing protein [Bacteroidales bacterium]|nr:heavy-metal-associated domain-containing protein [Bacteroidales bacterium]